MDRKARILVLDDSEADADLVRLQIRRRDLDCDTQWVSDRDGFLGALGAFAPDLVLADYTIPGFSGMEALRICRERLPDTPLIFVSGSIGEEAAVDALKSGATDYVLKGQLVRLVPAIVRALREVDDRADRRRLEKQFHQAQKMEAVGQLASGIAHDFNNLLTVISGYTELALAGVPESDPLHSHLREVRSAGERAATLTRQLLAFGRKSATQQRAVCIDAVVANMDRLLRRVIGEDVTLATMQGSLAANVLGDNGQFEQVLMNLAVNARDAMPNGGKLTIETGVEDLGSGDPRLRYGLKPGRHVRLSVTDTGTGMDAATQSRIFEPFFTTKAEGKGTGLGLATVYGIVRQSGGCIFVDSEPGKGTTFRVYFPCADVPAEPGAAPAPVARSKGGREKVLVVEDSEAVLGLACSILRGQGYEVLPARTPDEAIGICRREGATLDLVLTDVVMPDMNGLALVNAVRSHCPRLGVLYMSGYTEATLAHHGLRAKDAAYLPKPFTPEVLSRRVRETLDAR